MTLTAAPKVPPDDLVVVGGAVRSLLPPSLGPEVAAMVSFARRELPPQRSTWTAGGTEAPVGHDRVGAPARNEASSSAMGSGAKATPKWPAPTTSRR